MTTLTRKQAQVLNSLEQNPSLSLSDIARSLNIHYVVLVQHIKALHAKGYLSYKSNGKGKAPTVNLFSDSRKDHLLHLQRALKNTASILVDKPCKQPELDLLRQIDRTLEAISEAA